MGTRGTIAWGFLSWGNKGPASNTHIALTKENLIEAARQSLVEYEAGPLPHSIPYMPLTDATLQMLAGLRPKLLATMHGSSFSGDGERALRELAAMYAETLGRGRISKTLPRDLHNCECPQSCKNPLYPLSC